jgi:hypothetical protein
VGSVVGQVLEGTGGKLVQVGEAAQAAVQDVAGGLDLVQVRVVFV